MGCSRAQPSDTYLGSIGVMTPTLSSRAAGVQAQVLAVTRADHLDRLGETLPDAHRKCHCGQSECVDGEDHPHAADGLGDTTVGEVRAHLEWEVGEDRGDDQRMFFLEPAPARSNDCRTTKLCMVATGSGSPATS